MTLSTDDPITTKEFILRELREMEKMRKEDHAALERRVQAIADAIDGRDKKQVAFRVRLWAWFKKVLSFASGEAGKIRLEDEHGDR